MHRLHLLLKSRRHQSRRHQGAELVAAARREIEGLDSAQPIYEAVPFSSIPERWLYRYRIAVWWLTVLAALALSGVATCRDGSPWDSLKGMTLTLNLPHDLEHRLTAEAFRLGLPLETCVLRLLSKLPRDQPTSSPSNGAELLAYWRREGLIGSRSDIEDPQEYARTLRRQAEQRSRS